MRVKLDPEKLKFVAVKKRSGQVFNPIFRYDPVAKQHTGRVLYLTDHEGGRYIPNEEIEVYLDLRGT